jgi:hypothetical protein
MLRNLRGVVAAATGLGLAAPACSGSGSGGLRCGAGTVQSGDECVVAPSESDAASGDDAAHDQDTSVDAAMASGASADTAPGGHCGGAPTLCGSLAVSDCSKQAGCAVGGTCGPTAACMYLGTEAECTINHCTWTADCFGAPSGNCLGSTYAKCVSVPGCVWQ